MADEPVNDGEPMSGADDAARAASDSYYAARSLWYDSDEAKKLRLWATIVMLIWLAGIIGLGLWLFTEYVKTRELPLVPAVLFGAVFSVGYVGLVILVLHRSQRRRRFIDRMMLSLSEDLQQRERDIADAGSGLDLATLWSVTQQRIEYYHQIATRQSEASFRNGQIASYAGFGLLFAIGIVALFVGNTLSAIALSVVSVAGAAMTSFLGATFMRAQSEASAQLREFFAQPVEFSRILGAERLIETLPESDRAESVKLVVQAIMRSGQDGSRSAARADSAGSA